MFNITRYGNVVNIDSSGVDFNITPVYVSGTSFIVANIEAIGYSWEVTSSGTVANIKLVTGDCELRNNVGYLYGVEMGKPPRDASGISGNAHLILYTNKLYFSGIVRNGDYVYLIHSSYFDGLCEVIEYKISDATTQTITIIDDPLKNAGECYISMIQDRKVLVYSNDDDNSENIFILDFSDLTETLTTTMSSPFYISTIKKADGSVWMYVMGYNSDGDWEIQYLNYSLGGSWSNSTTSLAPTVWPDNIPVFSGENYIVIPYVMIDGSSGSHFKFKTYCLLYNLNTNTFSTSNALNTPTVTNGLTSWFIDGIGEDVDTGDVYLCGNCSYESSSPPSKYTTAEQWSKLDPDDGTLTEIYSRVGYDIDPTQLYRSVTFTSKEHCYIARDPENDIWLASTLYNYGTMTFPLYFYSTCRQLDDAGSPSMWWWDDSTHTLHRDNIDGSGGDSFSPGIEENYTCTNMLILHAKNCILMGLHEQSGITHYYRWYLID